MCALFKLPETTNKKYIQRALRTHYNQEKIIQILQPYKTWDCLVPTLFVVLSSIGITSFADAYDGICVDLSREERSLTVVQKSPLFGEKKSCQTKR